MEEAHDIQKRCGAQNALLSKVGPFIKKKIAAMPLETSSETLNVFFKYTLRSADPKKKYLKGC